MAESLAPAPTVDVVVGQPSHTFKELIKPKPEENNIIAPSVANVANSSTVATPPKQASVLKASPEKEKSKPSFNDVKSTPSIVPNSSQASLSISRNGRVDVDDFVPDQNAIDNFFDDDTVQQTSFGIDANIDDDDDDDDVQNVNPMVAGFTDDLVSML